MNNPKRPSRAATLGFALALATITLAPGSARAQNGAEMLAALRACALVGVERARLACFDGVFADEAAREDDRRAKAAEDPPAPAATPARTVPAAAPVRSAPAPAEAPATAVRSAPAPAEAPASAPPPQAAVRKVPIESDASTEAGSGAGMVTIVEIRMLAPGKSLFVSADGRRFVQTSGGSGVHMPNVPFRAALQEGAFGSTFLAPENRPRVRVAESR